MNCSYDEIVKALGRPAWWNEYAAPRYTPFAPRHVGNIYADDCALVLIACQGCGDSFRVCFSDNDMHRFLSRHAASLRDEITGGVIHYGDPPNIHCCPSGPTMNCEDLEVLEFWTRRNEQREWVRLHEFEILLPDSSHVPDLVVREHESAKTSPADSEGADE